MKVFTVYKTTNIINNKIYYGFHSIDHSQILRTTKGQCSCFADEYLGSGKLIKRAIARYGRLSFHQEIIEIYDNKEDAETKEAEIVDRVFTQRDDNYNIALGGNVRAFSGINNPFYGKHHTNETKKRIRESRLTSNLPTYQIKIKNTLTGEIYKGYGQAITALGFNVNNKNIKNKIRAFIYEKCYLGELILDDICLQQHAIRMHEAAIKRATEFDIRRETFSKMISERFTGTKQTDTQIALRVDAMNKWKLNNPDKHIDRMNKINKNPEKIRKTAEKHRGMKRSEETKQRIRESKIGLKSNTKDKTTIWNPETQEIRYIPKTADCPVGWIFGKPKEKSSRGKAYNNGVHVKLFKDNENIPIGWVRGALPKPRKSKPQCHPETAI